MLGVGCRKQKEDTGARLFCVAETRRHSASAIVGSFLKSTKLSVPDWAWWNCALVGERRCCCVALAVSLCLCYYYCLTSGALLQIEIIVLRIRQTNNGAGQCGQHGKWPERKRNRSSVCDCFPTFSRRDADKDFFPKIILLLTKSQSISVSFSLFRSCFIQSVLDNPTCFLNPFQFEITFECLQELDDDLEWKVLYVGSAQDSHQDQVLDEILVGPVPIGLNKFVLQADPPDTTKLPDILGVTVILVTCSFKEREFVRIGYYVNNEYLEEVLDPQVGGPTTLDLQKVQRQILADKPRVTKFPISWGNEEKEPTTNTNTIGVDDNAMEDTAVGTPDTAIGTDTSMDVEQ